MTFEASASDPETLRHALSCFRSGRAYAWGEARSCELVAQMINGFMGTTNHSMDTVYDPEVAAAEFYLLNHVLAFMRGAHHLDEPIPDLIWIAYEYDRVTSKYAAALFSYLTLITTRESRHKQKDVSTLFYGVHDPVALTFIDALPDGSAAAAKRFRAHPPKCSFTAYVSAVRDTFYKGGFGSAFGGKKWGKIAECLLHFAKGDFSAEMMVDHAWALQHNGGAMFNKGMIFCHPNTSGLYQVLDVQRAGMMPQFWFSDPDCPKSPLMGKVMTAALNAYGDDLFGGSSQVNWDEVVLLGAMSSKSKAKANTKMTQPAPQKKKAGAKTAEAQAAKDGSITFGPMGGMTKEKKERAA